MTEDENKKIEDESVESSRVGESRLIEWMNELFSEAKRARTEQAKDEEWDGLKSGFWGDQWGGAMPSFKPPIVINDLKTLILTEVSDVTDNTPKIFVTKDPMTGERDKQVEEFIAAYWVKEKIDLKIMMAFLDAMILPAGFITVILDPSADYGKGNVKVEVRNARSVYPDPDATDDDNWTYCFLKDIMDLTEIRRRWTKTGKRVIADARYSSDTGEQKGKRSASTGKYTGPLSGSEGAESSESARGRAEVLSLFIEDDAIDQTVEEYEENGENKLRSVERKKYPYGRLIQKSGEVILYDGPTPYEDRLVPVARIVSEPWADEFWVPSSPVAQVLELQQASNKMDSLVVENAIRLNSGQIVASSDSGLNPMSAANIPGQMILINPGSRYEIIYPNPMPADMIEGGPRLRGQMSRVLGFTESRIGVGQRGNISAELTETEISQTMGLSRLRARLLHSAVQKIVSMIFARMSQVFTTNRMIPSISGGNFNPVTWTPVTDPSRYSTHVDPSSFDVKSKTMIQRLYLTLAKMGKIDDESLLECLEVPDYKEKAKKLKEQLQLMAQAGLMKKGKK